MDDKPHEMEDMVHRKREENKEKTHTWDSLSDIWAIGACEIKAYPETG